MAVRADRQCCNVLGMTVLWRTAAQIACNYSLLSGSAERFREGRAFFVVTVCKVLGSDAGTSACP